MNRYKVIIYSCSCVVGLFLFNTCIAKPYHYGLGSAKFFQSVFCDGSGDDAFCTGIGSTWMEQSANRGKNWISMTLPGIPWGMWDSYDAISCAGEGTERICIAAGYSKALESIWPILIQTTNNGKQWNLIYNGIDKDCSAGHNCGFLHSTACINGKPASCFAAGTDYTRNTSFFVGTQDGGKTWNRYKGALFSLNKIYCNKSGSYCIGFNGQYIAQSNDSGITWHTPILTMPPLSNFNAITCLENTKKPVCMAVGGTYSGPAKAVVAVTVNGGKTWRVKIFPNLSSFSDISCVADPDNQNSGICIAGGRELIRSDDLGATWQILPDIGAIQRIVCKNDLQRTICLAMKPYPYPAIVRSENGGRHWKTLQIPYVKNFSDINCSHDGFCIISGDGLVSSADYGLTWQVVPGTVW